jgi:hypothetical protein
MPTDSAAVYSSARAYKLHAPMIQKQSHAAMLRRKMMILHAF